MDIKSAVLHYYPYWILGIIMVWATLRSEHRDLMEVKPKSLGKFLKTMAIVTMLRCIMMYFFPPSLESAAPILQIPLWLTATVGWEDAVHTLPLAITARFLGDSKLAKVIQYALIGLVMFSFGLGHTYQGVFAACMISLYIPIVTNLGKKHGFGTVMLAHMMYDFITLLTVRLFLGL